MSKEDLVDSPRRIGWNASKNYLAINSFLLIAISNLELYVINLINRRLKNMPGVVQIVLLLDPREQLGRKYIFIR